jgi:DNA repair exonuclease SbcCD ATPase subunit
MAKKHPGDKTGQNQRHYLKYREKILAKNRARYQANRERELKRLDANKKTEKGRARAAVHSAVRSGKLVRSDLCEACGNKAKTHGHHEDYSNPLDVVWLCTACHGKAHSNKGLTR